MGNVRQCSNARHSLDCSGNPFYLPLANKKIVTESKIQMPVMAEKAAAPNVLKM
jgi:hypothetical protein